MHSEKKFPFSIISSKLKKKIFQPELRSHLIYGYGYKKLVDGIISNVHLRAAAALLLRL